MEPLVAGEQDEVEWKDLRKRLHKTYLDFTEVDWRKQAEKMNESQVYLNDIYQVHRDRLEQPGSPVVIHLSVKRLDGGAVHDWRHMQEIKNQLVGPENEGVEVFPAESRLHDSANQFHIWVMEDESITFPFGWTDRVVEDGTGIKDPKSGTTQRPFEKKDDL